MFCSSTASILVETTSRVHPLQINIQPAINPVASEFETQMMILSIKKSRHDEVLHYKNIKDPIMKIIVPDLCLSQYRLEV
jgi:hypothetical protein